MRKSNQDQMMQLKVENIPYIQQKSISASSNENEHDEFDKWCGYKPKDSFNSPLKINSLFVKEEQENDFKLVNSLLRDNSQVKSTDVALGG